MSTRSVLKGVFWLLVRFSGPVLAARLWCRMVARHGLRSGQRHYRALPPGDMRWVDREWQSDQKFYLKRAAEFGPIFRCNTRAALTFTVVGNELARRIFSANEAYLESRYKNLDALFPIGHLRSMHGPTHRRFRQIFVRAMRPELMAASEVDLRKSTRAVIDAMSARIDGTALSMEGAVVPLRDITTQMLIRLFLGIPAPSEAGLRLVDCYNRMTTGVAPAYRYVGKNEAFEEIQAVVAEQVQLLSTDACTAMPDSVLKRMVIQGDLDDTSVGILAYMVETGRFDLFSLLRWVLHYLALNPHLAAEVRQERATGASTSMPASRACVLETLRSNQSEAIQRVVTRDLECEGYFFPAGSQIQVCLWEAHKDPKSFPCPFQFDSERFRKAQFTLDQFAPFGLDQHRCVASEYVIALASLFVEELAAASDVRAVAELEPIRGRYHWEPNPEFAVLFTRAS